MCVLGLTSLMAWFSSFLVDRFRCRSRLAQNFCVCFSNFFLPSCGTAERALGNESYKFKPRSRPTLGPKSTFHSPHPSSDSDTYSD